MKHIKTPKYRLNQNGRLRMDWQYEEDSLQFCPYNSHAMQCGVECPMFSLLSFGDRHSVTLHCCNRVIDVEVE